MADATDFGFAVDHRIETDALTVFLAHAARLAEIDIAGQFADDQDIQPGNDFRFQRRSIGQFRVKNGRTQIGEQVEVFANPQQTTLRALFTGQRIPLRTTHGTKQDGVGFACQLLRRFGIRIARRINCTAAQQGFFHLKLEIKRIKNTHCLSSNFRTNAVTRQNTDLHVFSSQANSQGWLIRRFSSNSRIFSA